MLKLVYFTLIIILFNFSESSLNLEVPVINLNTKNFEEKVLKSKEVWLILFYSDNEDFNKLKPE